MSKWIGTIGLLSLFAIPLQVNAAWSSTKKTDNRPQNTRGFNNPDNRGFYITGEYLFWLPRQDDLFYAVKQTPDTSSAIQKTNNKYKQPHYGLSSGGRIGIGGYTSDSWDVGFTGMYIYGSASSSTHLPSDSPGSTVIPDFNTNLFSTNANKAHAHQQLNFGTLDFSIGREFFLTHRFAVHPFIGLRGVGMRQDFTARYLSMFSSAGAASLNVETFFKAKNTTWGAGPRAGIDMEFYMCKGFAFLGGFSGSIVLARYNTHQKYFGQQLDAAGTAFTPAIVKTSDHDLCIRTNIDAYFGLGWDTWYNCNKCRFHIALLAEASEWFNFNQFNDNFSTTSATTGTPVITIAGLRRHGDLAFLGGTLRLQFDF